MLVPGAGGRVGSEDKLLHTFIHTMQGFSHTHSELLFVSKINIPRPAAAVSSSTLLGIGTATPSASDSSVVSWEKEKGESEGKREGER
jgi:hypothetical protein